MKISNALHLGQYFTFTPSKSKPIYNWFFYKEAYSPECVDFFLKKFNLNNGKIADPFCGIGTTLLYAKSKGFSSFGSDASPLATFISKVKCENYSEDDILKLQNFSKTMVKEILNTEPIQNWKPEFFSLQKIFPKSSLNFILRTRNFINKIEEPKIQNVILLALLSILPQSSLLIKDGGVMKHDKKKKAFPAKHAFKRKLKKIISNLKKQPIIGIIPQIHLGNAKNIPLDDGSVDAVITSPPYLNNIDYTKIYGLELSLLDPSFDLVKSSRKRTMISFDHPNLNIKNVPQEAEEFGIKYPVIGGYFSDMEKVLKESHRILKPGGFAVFVVGNSIMYDLHILVDVILGEIGERIGFEVEILTALKRTAKTQNTKIETRESAVVLKKL